VASASSSPPSPLPASVGSGLQRYVFAPFSPPGGSSSPLLRVVRSEPRLHYSALSMDAFAKEPCSRQRPARRGEKTEQSTLATASLMSRLLAWFLGRLIKFGLAAV
jgi:hypothetical protein